MGKWEYIPFYLFSEQVVETWLKESASKISTPWDFTAIHVNKSSLNDVKRDIVSDVICFRKNPAVIVIVACFQDHYWKTYGQPIWVTELACVNGASGLCSFSSGRYWTLVTDHNTFTPCTNQQQINLFIHQVVDYFEHDSRVYAYAFSNGEVWPMMRNGVFRYAFEVLNWLLTFIRGGSESGKAYLDAISRYH